MFLHSIKFLHLNCLCFRIYEYVHIVCREPPVKALVEEVSAQQIGLQYV